MAVTYKILSALLSYPTEDLQAAAGSFVQLLDDEALLPEADRQALVRLIKQIAGEDLYELQERYVQLFDRTRSLSLHLFEHVHGESRDRGQAMVDLTDLYAQHGLEITANELPDHLPLFLEFLSTLPEAEAREHLGQEPVLREVLGGHGECGFPGNRTRGDHMQEHPGEDCGDERA